MAKTRPYLLVFKGKTHIIEAPAAAHAVQHIVGADISELRPARAAEVTAWIRGGNDIPVVSVKSVTGEDAPQKVEQETITRFDENDALTWLRDQEGMGSSPGAYAAWGRIVSTQRMTIEDFDIIRTASPTFGAAIADFGATAPAEDVEMVRASLEEDPMSLDDVVEAIGKAKQQELFVAEMERTDGGEDRMVGSTGHLDDGQ